jgi:hypothetical protein
MIGTCTVAMNVRVPSVMDAGAGLGSSQPALDCELHYDANRRMSERQWTAGHKTIKCLAVIAVVLVDRPGKNALPRHLGGYAVSACPLRWRGRAFLSLGETNEKVLGKPQLTAACRVKSRADDAHEQGNLRHAIILASRSHHRPRIYKRSLRPVYLISIAKIPWPTPATHPSMRLRRFVSLCRPSLRFASSIILWQIHASLQDGFKSGRARDIKYRKHQLLQLAYLLKDNKDRFNEAAQQDLGRSYAENEMYVC